MPCMFNSKIFVLKKDKLYTFLPIKLIELPLKYKSKKKYSKSQIRLPLVLLFSPDSLIKDSFKLPKPIFVYDGRFKKELKFPHNALFKRKPFLKFKHYTINKKIGYAKRKKGKK